MQLGYQRKVKIGKFKGADLVSIRDYYVKDGIEWPTQRGMDSFRVWSNILFSLSKFVCNLPRTTFFTFLISLTRYILHHT